MTSPMDFSSFSRVGTVCFDARRISYVQELLRGVNFGPLPIWWTPREVQATAASGSKAMGPIAQELSGVRWAFEC